MRRVKRGHEIALAYKIKENLRRLWKYVMGKRVTRQRICPLKDQQGNLC